MLRGILFFIAIFFQSLLLTYEHQIAIAAIFKDEAPYLKEWIDYHRLVGVEHFWLYNDESTDHFADVLKPYVKDGIVDVIDWSETRKKIVAWQGIQCEAYRDAMRRALGRTEWLALIDTDEFILPMKNRTITSCLKKHFPQAKAIFMQWLVFGTSGVTLAANESMLRRLTFCTRLHHFWNCIGKTIVRPEHVLINKIWNPHHVPLKNNSDYTSGSNTNIPMVNDDLHIASHQAEYIRINHYFFRDEKFFREVKIPRKLKRGIPIKELWDLYNESLKKQDHKIIKLLNEISP